MRLQNSRDVGPHRCKFYGKQRVARGWEPDNGIPGIEPVNMRPWEPLVPQLVDEVGAKMIRVDVEVARVVVFERPGEEREVFENVSEG
jgi:hypothetical protein